MRDDDTVLAGPGGIHMVIADAEAGDDRELGQLCHELFINAAGRRTDRERLQPRRKLRQQRLRIFGRARLVQIESRRESIDHGGLRGSEDQYIGLFVGHSLTSWSKCTASADIPS